MPWNGYSMISKTFRALTGAGVCSTRPTLTLLTNAVSSKKTGTALTVQEVTLMPIQVIFLLMTPKKAAAIICLETQMPRETREVVELDAILKPTGLIKPIQMILMA